jgi:hypothetical protein
VQPGKLPLDPSLERFVGLYMTLVLKDFAADRISRLGEHPGHTGYLVNVYEGLAVSESILANNARGRKIRAGYDMYEPKATGCQSGCQQ